MSSQLLDDADYPYSPRPAPPTAEVPPGRSLAKTMRALWWWVWRSCAAIGVALLLAAIAGGIAAIPAARRGWLVTSLERHGTQVSFWPKKPHADAWYPEIVSEQLGDWWWSDLKRVSVRGGGYFESIFHYVEFTENDLRLVCDACGRFRKLQEFEISHNSFSCSQIANWPQLETLEVLNVESTQLTDADLSIIGRMIGLKRLRLGSAKLTTDGIAHLARLPGLENLTLEHVQIDVTDDEHQPGFAALQSLVIGQSPDVADAAIACFGSPPNLKEVNFNRTPIGDAGLAQLLQNGKVNSLIISEGAVTDAGLTTVANYTAPLWFVFSHMPLTDQGLRALSGKEFPTVILSHSAITDEGFRTLAEIKGLEYVSLSDTKVTGAGVRYLNNQTPLKHLDLAGAALTHEGIEALAKANCSELELARTMVGDGELLLFADNDNLTQLDVTETSVTEEGVRAFYKARKKRLGGAGSVESLMLNCDHPEVVASILGIDAMGGLPILPDFSEGYANEGD